jgi:hypothetical protein
MQDDYGFTVYFDDDGTLKRINSVETKPAALQDAHAPVQLNKEQENKDASGRDFDPAGG